jgi:hypothetical protein
VPPSRSPGRLGRVIFGTLSRTLLLTFLVPFLWSFLFLQLFLSLSSLLIFFWLFPYLSPKTILPFLPDHCLVALPITISAAVMYGGLTYVARVRRSGGFLQAALAGGHPALCQMPLVLFGLLLTLGLWWHTAQVLPQVQYRSRYPRVDPALLDLSLPGFLAGRGSPLQGLDLHVAGKKGGRLSGLELTGCDQRGALALAAAEARFTLAGDPLELALELTGGRLLALDEAGAITRNLRFGKLSARLDARRMVARPKSEMLHLRYYTNQELDRLPEQKKLNLSRGLRITDKQEKRLAQVPCIKLARVQLALTPLFFILAIVLLLGRYPGGRPGTRRVLLVIGCLGLFFPLAVYGVHMPLETEIDSPWAAFLPLAGAVSFLSFTSWLVDRAEGGR